MSLWNIHWYEIAYMAASLPLGVLALVLVSPRARRNRRQAWHRRQAERDLVRRLRTW